MSSRHTLTGLRFAIVSGATALAVAIASATWAASNIAADPPAGSTDSPRPDQVAADENGPTGMKGTPGSSATSDTLGPTGAGLSPANGSIGPSGEAGPTGSGIARPTGSNGQSGSTGPTGSGGSNGSLGSTGPTGQGTRP